MDRLVDDNRRTEFLRRRGFKVMRFWDNEFLKETKSVLDAIYNELNRSPSPRPLSQRERAKVSDGDCFCGRDSEQSDSDLEIFPLPFGERDRVRGRR